MKSSTAFLIFLVANISSIWAFTGWRAWKANYCGPEADHQSCDYTLVGGNSAGPHSKLSHSLYTSVLLQTTTGASGTVPESDFARLVDGIQSFTTLLLLLYAFLLISGK